MKAPLAQGLDIPLRCSRRLKIAYALIFGLVFLVLIVTPLSRTARTILMGVGLVAAVPVMRQLKVLESIKGISVSGESIHVDVDGTRVPVNIVGNSLVSQTLTIFSCYPKEDTRADFPSPTSVILLSDSIDQEHFRQLRVFLKQFVAE